MDFIKNAVSKGEEAMKNNNSGGSSNNNNQQAGNAGKEDYVDKAVEFGSKKAGYNIDRQTEEKYTDEGREAFEKYTGKNVPSNVSN